MFTETERYRIKVIFYLHSIQENEQYVTLDKMAEATSIPRGYLGGIINDLSREGWVQTRKGRGGGVRLNFQPSEVSAREFFRRFGILDLEHAPGDDPCCVPSTFERCPFTELLHDMLGRYKNRSLAEFMAEFEGE